MQLKCAWCMKDTTCDMGEGEDCPDFKLQPQFAPHVIRSSILEVYPEITRHVEVVWTKGAFIPSFTITIILKKLLTVFERADLVMEVERQLQAINDETLHMEDGDFTVHVAQAVEHSAEVPEGVGEDNVLVESTPSDGPNPLKDLWEEGTEDADWSDDETGQVLEKVGEFFAGEGVEFNANADGELEGYFDTGHVMKLGTLRQMEDGAVVWVRYREGGEDRDRIDGAYRINQASDTEWGLSDGSSFAADIELKGPDSADCIDEKGGEGAMILFVAGHAVAKKQKADWSDVEVPDTLPDDVGEEE